MMIDLKNIHDFTDIDGYECWIEENLELFTDEQLTTIFSEIEKHHKVYSQIMYLDYNIRDVEIIKKLDESILLFELITSLAYYSHMPYDSVLSPLRTWDAIIYNSLADQGIVVPENKQASKEKYEGAYVKEPIPGLYRWIMSFDLTSLK